MKRRILLNYITLHYFFYFNINYDFEFELEFETSLFNYIINLQKVKMKMISEILCDERLSSEESIKTISFEDVLKMFKNKL